MAFLSVPTFDRSQFTLCTDGTLASEASDLRFGGPGRLYDDACDEGIALRSAAGKLEHYYLTERKRDRENELVAWEFLPVRREAPKVVIFND